jgi:hypothetical protein
VPAFSQARTRNHAVRDLTGSGQFSMPAGRTAVMAASEGRGPRSRAARRPGGCVSARCPRRGTAPSRWLGCARAR